MLVYNKTTLYLYVVDSAKVYRSTIAMETQTFAVLKRRMAWQHFSRHFFLLLLLY
jgi:hypothetical protein